MHAHRTANGPQDKRISCTAGVVCGLFLAMSPGGMLGRLSHALPSHPVLQIIISTNKEQVLNEKKMTVGFGTTVVTGHSEVIQSGEYDDFEVFFKKVTSTWADTWANVYGANPAGG